MRVLTCILLLSLPLMFINCDKDCYEDPNLQIPSHVFNVSLQEASYGPTYIGWDYYPFGVPDVYVFQSVNQFYSVKRFNPLGGTITFYWSGSTFPAFGPDGVYPFSELQNGETVTIYITVVNTKTGGINCIYEEAKEIHSILRVNARVQDGQIAGTQKIEQTQYSVPAGKYAVFDFPVEYIGVANYDLNLRFDSNGSLVETDTTDNNYTVNVGNLEIQ